MIGEDPGRCCTLDLRRSRGIGYPQVRADRFRRGPLTPTICRCPGSPLHHPPRSSGSRAQSGAVSREQALEHGLTLGQIKVLLARRHWQAHLPGVYLCFTGPVSPRAQVWGAVLYAGAGATASLRTAAWLWTLRKDFPPRIDVCVPFGRRVTDQPGIRIATRRNLDALRHPVLLPPRTRVEDTVLDLAERAVHADEVVALLTGACQRRLTTAARLGGCASRRKRLRWARPRRGRPRRCAGRRAVSVGTPLSGPRACSRSADRRAQSRRGAARSAHVPRRALPGVRDGGRTRRQRGAPQRRPRAGPGAGQRRRGGRAGHAALWLDVRGGCALRGRRPGRARPGQPRVDRYRAPLRAGMFCVISGVRGIGEETGRCYGLDLRRS